MGVYQQLQREGNTVERASGAKEVPRLIQAGMGVRISSSKLARETSRLGAVGVVSSVGLRHVIIEEIRSGDREAIELAGTFPIARYIDDLLAFAPGGKKHTAAVPLDHPDPSKGELPKRLSAIAAYVEVLRSRSGHDGMVGINVMWKCSLTVLPSLYGAMLAGVDMLLCGAGVPMELPDIVSRIQNGQDLEYLPLHGTDTNTQLSISGDRTLAQSNLSKSPMLVPILSNFAFPKRILDVWSREYGGVKPFAFVLENHAAGGHNAPPRDKESYGERDDITAYFEKVRDLGTPVYVAGAGSTREEYLAWREKGAYGLQVGSRFALCAESGLRDDLRNAVIAGNAQAETDVLTSSRLSSTGYPFKYVPLAGTLAEQPIYDSRRRICNKGYLLHSHVETDDDGSVKESYVCPAMPAAQYVRLGGEAEETVARVCLCNALLAAAGLAEPGEPPLITLGTEGLQVTELHSAREVIEEILTPEHVQLMEDRLRRGQPC